MISEELSSMSKFLSSQDLVDLGIFSSVAATYFARKRGNSPKWIKLKRKILYQKCDVIDFLEKRSVVNQVIENEKQQGIMVGKEADEKQSL